MENTTREKLDLLFAALAKNHGVPTAQKLFSASPTKAQVMVDKRAASIDFLTKINVKTVKEREGEKIFGSMVPVIPSRTDTANDNKRKTRALMQLDPSGYVCKSSEFDVHITYEQLDAWAKFPNFNEKFMSYMRRGIALGQIKVGFYGESAAGVTDGDANPNGEDANVGWIQHLRNAGQVITDGAVANKLRLGAGGDYLNLDGMVFDTLQMVDEVHRERDDLVAVIGRDLLAMDKTQIYAGEGTKPSEKMLIETARVSRTYGGLPSMAVPYFPSRGLYVGPLDNLSLYVQETSVRQKVFDNSELDRVQHFNSENDAYVIEDTGASAVIEHKNVQLPGEFAPA